MSIKKHFEEGAHLVKPFKTIKELTEGEVESPDFLRNVADSHRRFRAPLDYSTASNFVKFGMAEDYYVDSIKRIYNTFPYDGSLAEKQQWENDSSGLDLYLLENGYPRSTGYAIFNPASAWTAAGDPDFDNNYGKPATMEYISIKGGPNSDPDESSIRKVFPDSQFSGSANLYNTASFRESNLKIDGAQGNTVEFWMNKSAILNSLLTTKREVIFDLHNGQAQNSANYGRLRIELDGAAGASPFLVTYLSGAISTNADNNGGTAVVANRFANQVIGSGITPATVADGNWHHYAFTFANSGTAVESKLYIDGQLNHTLTLADESVGEVRYALQGTIGALAAIPYEAGDGAIAATTGWGKLSGSLDDFRFWKTKRTSKEIGRNWYFPVGGGTNTDASNTKLGVYFKFNEGITADASIDSTVLDYSGRISNGTWTGYSSNSRNTGSAFLSSSYGFAEFEDPMVHASHPSVTSFLNAYTVEGQAYDSTNNSAIFHSLPHWITEADERTGNTHLRKLTQIISSYFDTAFAQIEQLGKVKDKEYVTGSFEKPIAIMDEVLRSTGLVVPELFVDAEIIESITNRDEGRLYETELNEVKNLIYKNIYNNINYIYKSKGAEKSARNLIRCFGVDSELVEINFYSDNHDFVFEDNIEEVSLRKRYIDFHHTASHGGTVYNFTNTTNTNFAGFVSGTVGEVGNGGLATTTEAEFIFPREFADHGQEETLRGTNTLLSSSLFGCHTPATTTGKWVSAGNDFSNFQVLCVRESLTGPNSRNAKFMLVSDHGQEGGPSWMDELTSSVYQDVFDNQKWNFAVRIKPKVFPMANLISSGSSAPDYMVEFVGMNCDAGYITEQFTLTASVNQKKARQLIASAKGFYLGAHRDDFNSSLLTGSDCRAGGLRHWLSYLDNDEIKAHAISPDNIGVSMPGKNYFSFEGYGADVSILGPLGLEVPKIDTLVLNWDFNDVTGSATDGTFAVRDISRSGSSSGVFSIDGRYARLENILRKNHAARGFGFPTSDTKNIADINYVYSAKKKLPESITSADMTNVLTDEEKFFRRDFKPKKYYAYVEKSMYNSISKEMLKMFSSIKDFNNLVGSPVNRYRQSYKALNKLRQLFFDRVDNTPSIEKYLNFYKWIDSSITIMVSQLLPVSLATSEELRDVIESHVLERNKYWSKFPTVVRETIEPEGTIQNDADRLEWGLSTIQLPSSAPDASKKALWWGARAERDRSHGGLGSANSIDLSSGNSAVDSNRESIRKIAARKIKGTSYAIKSSQSPGRLRVGIQEDLTGGSNSHVNRKPDYHKPFTRSTALNTGALEIATQISSSFINNDPKTGIEKERINNSISLDTVAEKQIDTARGYEENMQDGTKYIPFSIHSSSLENVNYLTSLHKYQPNSDIASNHIDHYGPIYQVPMQSPFTDTHVGGNQHRHAPLNLASGSIFAADGTTLALDRAASRPEAYDLAFSVGSLQIKAPANVAATFFRDETAKRPINIRNIKTSASGVHNTAGNYEKDYQIILTSDRLANNRLFVRAQSDAAIEFDLTSESNSSHTVSSPVYLSMKDIAKIRWDNLVTDHVIVSRFTPMGAPETHGDSLGGYGLDDRSAQYSIYSSVNYRNSLARSYVGNKSQDHAKQFGYDSETPSQGSPIHKTNRNTEYYPNASDVVSYRHDNFFVQHQIPVSDLQYSWITGSSTTTRSSYFKFVIDQKTDRATLQFTEKSQEYATSNFEYGGASATNAHYVDFNGLNTIIVEEVDAPNTSITSAANTLSSNLALSASGVYYDDHETFFNRALFGTDASTTPYANKATTGYAGGRTLNAILLNRGGIFGHSSWRQIRTGETSVIARNMKKDNRISVASIKNESVAGVPHTRSETVTFENFFESPVSTALPCLISEIRNAGSPEERVSYNLMTYSNNIEMFSSPILTNKSAVAKKEQKFPINSYKTASYFEPIYPASGNMFFQKVRERNNFAVDYWHSDRTLRIISDSDNSYGYSVPSASIWLLDGQSTFISDRSSSGLRLSSSVETGNNGEGELLNDYVTWHNGAFQSFTASITHDNLNPKPGALYSRRALRYYVHSGSASSDIPTGMNVFTHADGIPLYQVTGNNDRRVMYDSYAEYAEELRAAGKDHSIVPEFRISDHMDYYTKEADMSFADAFLTGTLSLTGSDIKDSSQEGFYKTYTNTDFMKMFSLVKKPSPDLPDAEVQSITLTCNALKKFIPYKGLHPAQRTLQLATMFSQSFYRDTILSGSGPINSGHHAHRPVNAAFFAPGIMFNTIKSGIAVDYPVMTASYNMAPVTGTTQILQDGYHTDGVHYDRRDHEVFMKTAATGYNDTYQQLRLAVSSSSGSNISKFDYRVPFEAILEPEVYLPKKFTVVDAEGWHPSASLNVTSTFMPTEQRQYKLAMHNFLAETVSFFLQDSKLTSMRSLPEGNFDASETDSVKDSYKMRVYLSKDSLSLNEDYPKLVSGSWGQLTSGSINNTSSFYMYDRPSAFGPPVHSVEAVYGAPTSGDDAVSYTSTTVSVPSLSSTANGQTFKFADAQGNIFSAVTDNTVTYANSTATVIGTNGLGTSESDRAYWATAIRLSVRQAMAYGITATTIDTANGSPLLRVSTFNLLGTPLVFTIALLDSISDPSLLVAPAGSLLDSGVTAPAFDFSSVTSPKKVPRYGVGYRPYTPPYYDGHSYAEITFKPPVGAEPPYTLGQIKNAQNTTVTYHRSNGSVKVYDDLINSSSFMYRALDYTSGSSDNISEVPSGATASFSDNCINHRSAMQLSSSLNLFSEVRVPVTIQDEDGKTIQVRTGKGNEEKAWVIQTKFETPMLDFSPVSASMPFAGTTTENSVVYKAPVISTRGMWHQHASASIDSDKGVKLFIDDSFIAESTLSATALLRLAAPADIVHKDVITATDSLGIQTHFILWKSPSTITVDSTSTNTYYVDAQTAAGALYATRNAIVDKINATTSTHGYSAELFDVDSFIVFHKELGASGNNPGLPTKTTQKGTTGGASADNSLGRTGARGSHSVGVDYGFLGKNTITYGACVSAGVTSSGITSPANKAIVSYGSVQNIFADELGLDHSRTWAAFGDNSHDGARSGQNNPTGSLAKLVGFQTGEEQASRVGQIATSKTVYEAVVAIPFIDSLEFENANDKSKKSTGSRFTFFKIDSDREKAMKAISDIKAGITEGVDPTIKDMAGKMSKYVFPPTLDFITNDSIEPFYMFIFEFSQNFDKQNLADIWQNVIPQGVGNDKIEKVSSSLTLHGARDIFDSAGRVQWMVFKVKQKGDKSYYKKLALSTGAETSTITSREELSLENSFTRTGSRNFNTPDYSFNWPYDFFSIIELVKLEEEVEFVQSSELASLTEGGKKPAPMRENESIIKSKQTESKKKVKAESRVSPFKQLSDKEE